MDLTARAREGGIDPIIGRDGEIRQLVDILTRRRQNNPMLVGEAGVGKTAVVEGLALYIAQSLVPPALRSVSLRQLDLALLQAGASLQGEFEKRLKAVIHEVTSAVQPIILFIDEAHTLIGAGGAAGQSDAANILKPALARGELRTIAATTWDEYKQHLESDPALARRFQVVKVDEPDTATAIEMLRAVATKLERHHHVRIREDAIHDAVTLSQRYLTGRRLPDKALSVLDTAAARVAVGQRSTPGLVQDAAQRVARLEEELQRLEREQATHADHRPRLAALMEAVDAARRSQTELESRWEAERAKVEHIRDLEHRMETRAADPEKLRVKVLAEREGLAMLQAEAPMVPLDVDGRAVADVVASWTGVPVGRMLTDEAAGLLKLPELLGARIIGQAEALDTISRRMRTSRAGLVDPHKPVGVFLLLGPSGVGKTETGAALADALYGGAQNMVVVNLSEYQEAHSVALLKGAPPGYVGYARGGVLTEAVRRRPYSVVLLDEVEKAHPDVLELFYQVFDKGTLEDGQGVVVDFRNTVILLTSNAGAELVEAACHGGRRPAAEALVDLLRPALRDVFPTALLGRLTLVPYFPLEEKELRRIVDLKLDAVRARFHTTHGATLRVQPAAADAVLDRCLGVGRVPAASITSSARTSCRRCRRRCSSAC
ncbi:MAG: type VI secretion system ATPase TssH [bacterium]